MTDFAIRMWSEGPDPAMRPTSGEGDYDYSNNVSNTDLTSASRYGAIGRPVRPRLDSLSLGASFSELSISDNNSCSSPGLSPGWWVASGGSNSNSNNGSMSPAGDAGLNLSAPSSPLPPAFPAKTPSPSIFEFSAPFSAPGATSSPVIQVPNATRMTQHDDDDSFGLRSLTHRVSRQTQGSGVSEVDPPLDPERLTQQWLLAATWNQEYTDVEEQIKEQVRADKLSRVLKYDPKAGHQTKLAAIILTK